MYLIIIIESKFYFYLFTYKASIFSEQHENSIFKKVPTAMDKNNDTNNKFYQKVAFLMYTEMVNFRPQS